MEREPIDERRWTAPPDPTRDAYSAWDTPESPPPAPIPGPGPGLRYGPPPPLDPSYVPPAQGQSSAGSPPEWTPPPKSHLGWSLFAMLCFLPFGIVSLVKGSSVKFLWSQGRRAEAQAASSSALTWALWSLITPPILFFGLVGFLLWVTFGRA